MEPTDIQLMQQVSRDDDHAFALLVMRYQKVLINFFYRLNWNRALAEDMAQDTFLRIYEARHRYQPTAKFKTYLFRIARNLWVDHVRRLARRGPVVSLDQEVNEISSWRDLIPDQDRGDAQAKKIERKMKEVKKAVGQLSPSQQELFTLVNIQGLKYQEISEILNIPLGTVKTRMHALMKKLRHTLIESS